METARNQSEWVVKRDDEIVRLREAGIAVVEIASRFLISYQRVYQILEKRHMKEPTADAPKS